MDGWLELNWLRTQIESDIHNGAVVLDPSGLQCGQVGRRKEVQNSVNLAKTKCKARHYIGVIRWDRNRK